MSTEQVAQVRERLAEVRALCEAVRDGYPSGPLVERLTGVWSMLPQEAVYIAAMSPDVVLRLVEWAEDVLDRHAALEHAFGPQHPTRAGEVYWRGCTVCKETLDGYDFDSMDWPCPEVTAVIKSWAP